MTRLSRHAAVIGLSLVLGLTGCGGGVAAEPLASAAATSSPTPSATTSLVPATPSPTAGALPAGTAPIEPGTYRMPKSATSAVDFTVTIPEGWTANHGYVFDKHPDAPDGLRFHAHVPDKIYADACMGDGERMAVGSSVDELVAGLLKQAGVKASGPVQTTLGGFPTSRINLTVPKGLDLKACRLEGNGLQIWFSHPSDDYFVLVPDGTASVYILDVDGQRTVFLTQHRPTTSDEDLRELQDVLDSIHIQP